MFFPRRVFCLQWALNQFLLTSLKTLVWAGKESVGPILCIFRCWNKIIENGNVVAKVTQLIKCRPAAISNDATPLIMCITQQFHKPIIYLIWTLQELCEGGNTDVSNPFGFLINKEIESHPPKKNNQKQVKSLNYLIHLFHKYRLSLYCELSTVLIF